MNKILATSGTLEGITKLVKEYYYSDSIYLTYNNTYKTYNVCNSQGVIPYVLVYEHKGRFKFREANIV